MDLTTFRRRPTCEVRIGRVTIGGDRPVAVQSMTNTDTNDTSASVAQIERIDRAGGEDRAPDGPGPARGREPGEYRPGAAVRRFCGRPWWPTSTLSPEVASIAAKHVDKVRINPGNYRNDHGEFEALIEQCRERGCLRCASG